MKPASKILAMTLRTAILVTGSCFLASFGHAAGPTVSTPNIFSSATASANSGLTQYGVGDPTAVNDGTDSQFFFQDNTTPEYLSLAGFDATSGIDSIVFFGNTYSNRTSPSVTIYTSPYVESGSDALDPSTTANNMAGDYTDLGNFNLPTNAPGIDPGTGYSTADDTYTDGTTSSGLTYDVLSGLDIAAGTKSILFSFGGSVYGEGNGFTEIQAFPTSDISPIPEPGTWAMLLMGVGILVGVLRFRNIRPAGLK